MFQPVNEILYVGQVSRNKLNKKLV